MEGSDPFAEVLQQWIMYENTSSRTFDVVPTIMRPFVQTYLPHYDADRFINDYHDPDLVLEKLMGNPLAVTLASGLQLQVFLL